MQAQSERLKVVSQNIATAEAVGSTSGGDQLYRRKNHQFQNGAIRATEHQHGQGGSRGAESLGFRPPL